MKNGYSEQLATVRRKAREEAESLLEELGFVSNYGGRWQGALDCQEYGSLTVTLSLPEEFADKLPEISVNRTSLPRKIPHLEKTGKVCIAGTTGLLLDAGNPRGIVAESLQRAKAILIEGLSGRNKDDLVTEFLAYWNEGAMARLWSICAMSEEPRVIQKVRLQRQGRKQTTTLFADSAQEAKEWASNIGWGMDAISEAFFLPLSHAFNPPDFDETLSVTEALEIIRSAANEDTWDSFRSWINTTRLPATVLLSLPLLMEKEHVLVGIRLPADSGKALKKAQNGFRPGKVPPSRQLTFSQHEPVGRLAVDRFDDQYLLYRGGATLPLLSETVVIVGCGSVGSYIAQYLAAAGVGHLKLVDPDVMKSENVHRHLLGASFVGWDKTVGIKTTLGTSFPHLKIEHREVLIEALLKDEPKFIADASLIVFALGDETLELRLNNVLGDEVPQVHAWVDPLGLGGHVLATGVSGGAGCYKCLFENDPEQGLFNQASFAAPGQQFQRAFAGCAGTFTPFANADAARTAIEAVRLVCDILTLKERENVLISWRGDDGDFTSLGFALSSRGKMFHNGERRRETGFSKAGCTDCQSHLL